MRLKFFLPVVVGSLIMAASAALAQGPAKKDFQHDINMQMGALKYQTDEAAKPKDEKPSKDGFLLMPQYYYSGNGSITSNLSDGSGGKLKMNSGHASGGGLIAITTKEINKTLSLGFMYQLISMEYEGGALQPDIPGLKVEDDISVISHAVAILANVDLEKYGRFNFHVLQAFDEFSGDRKTTLNGAHVSTVSMDNYSDRLTSLVGWYEIDAPLTENLTLTPYAGWRSMYAYVVNPFGEGRESKTDAWVHLLSGGAKLNYRYGLFGVGVSAGVNWRASHDDVAGFATRATEPNFAHAGFNTVMDPVVGAFGANASYVIPEFGVLLANWNGMWGANTNTQTLSIGLVIPF
ncbi:MAG: hypothetical protein LBO64_03250 [Desulfovibrio sp.]|jgi:hypothetical protein|nr:hypothetical protein [Desulfovibrio sp.]